MNVTAEALSRLPADLPAPHDDGAAAHLLGAALPPVALPATSGRRVVLADGPGYVVAYCYPMTGRPGEALPTDWDVIPGARGCTPQACAFRDHARELAAYGAHVYGVSTQTPAEQREAAERLHLPLPSGSTCRSSCSATTGWRSRMRSRCRRSSRAGGSGCGG